MAMARRPYNSPIREARAAETRGRILDAVRTIFETDPESSLNFDEVAKVSGVNRRTIFRHFANKDELLQAFWTSTNATLDMKIWPETGEDLMSMPPKLFEAMERIEGFVRAAHLSPTGHMMRMQVNAERLAAFRGSLADISTGMDPVARGRLEALSQVLFSATTWLSLRDYWGMSGREAGDAVVWGINALIDAAIREKSSPG